MRLTFYEEPLLFIVDNLGQLRSTDGSIHVYDNKDGHNVQLFLMHEQSKHYHARVFIYPKVTDSGVPYYSSSSVSGFNYATSPFSYQTPNEIPSAIYRVLMRHNLCLVKKSYRLYFMKRVIKHLLPRVYGSIYQ